MRRTDREITDDATKRDIIEKAHIINLGILDFPAPYVVPANYGYEFVDNQLKLYIHGASRGKKRGLIAANPEVSFSLVNDCGLDVPKDGAPLYEFSYFYRSVLGTGTATLVGNLAEKEHALRLVLKHANGRDIPGEISQEMLQRVGIIRIDVAQYTGKQHSAE